MAQRGTPLLKFPRFARKNSLSLDEQPSSAAPCLATDDAHVNSSMNSLAAAFQQKTQQLQEASSQLLKAREEIQSLQSQVSSFSSNNCRLRIVNDKLQVSQSKIEEEVDSLKSMLAKAQQRSDETKKVLQTVEDDCRTWLPRLKEMLNSSYETRLSQVNQSWEGLLNSLKEELEGSQTTAQENYKKYQQALGERDSFNTQLTESKSQLEGLKNEIQTISKERDQMKAGWNQLKLSFNHDLENRILKTIQDLESERILHQSTIKEYQDTLNKKTLIETELKQTSHQLQEILEKTQGERDDQKLILAETEHLREHVSQLTTNIRKLQSENASLSASLALSQNELASIRDQHQQTTISHDELKLAATNASKDKNLLEEKLSQLENRLKTTTEDLEKTNSVRTELSQTLQTLEEALANEERLRIQSQQLTNELSAQLMNTNRDLDAKCKDAEDLKAELTPCKEQLRQLEIQLEGRTLNLEGIKTQLEKYQNSNSELEQELSQLKSQLMEKSIQLDYRGMRLAEMEKKLQETAPATTAEAQAADVDAENLDKKLTRKSFELEVTQEQLKQVEANLTSAEKQVAALQAKGVLLEQSLQLFQKKAQAQNEEKERLKKRTAPPAVPPEPEDSADFQDAGAESPAKKAVTFKDPSPGEMYELVLKVEAKANELERQRQQRHPPSKTAKNPAKIRTAKKVLKVEASPILRSSTARSYGRHHSAPVLPESACGALPEDQNVKQSVSSAAVNEYIDID